jgi:hypothetical protein
MQATLSIYSKIPCTKRRKEAESKMYSATEHHYFTKIFIYVLIIECANPKARSSQTF